MYEAVSRLAELLAGGGAPPQLVQALKRRAYGLLLDLDEAGKVGGAWAMRRGAVPPAAGAPLRAAAASSARCMRAPPAGGSSFKPVPTRVARPQAPASPCDRAQANALAAGEVRDGRV